MKKIISSIQKNIERRSYPRKIGELLPRMSAKNCIKTSLRFETIHSFGNVCNIYLDGINVARITRCKIYGFKIIFNGVGIKVLDIIYDEFKNFIECSEEIQKISDAEKEKENTELAMKIINRRIKIL